MVDDPARLQAEIVAFHRWERQALLAGDISAAREVAIQKFELIAALDDITQSN